MPGAFRQKFFRQVSVRDDYVDLIKAAYVKTAFYADFGGIHYGDYLIRLPQRSLFQDCFVAYAAAKARACMIACDAKERLMEIDSFQFFDSGKSKHALAVAVQCAARQHDGRAG